MNQIEQCCETEEDRKGISSSRNFKSKYEVLICSPHKRHVYFDEQQAIAPAQFDIDENDMEYLWYSLHELRAIRKDTRNALRAYRTYGGVLFSEEIFCFRGLEDWDHTGVMKDKKSRVKNIIQGILDEQTNQKNMRINDPKGLQVLSCACSKYAKGRALVLGRKDEEDMRKCTRRPSLQLTDLVLKDSDGKLQTSGSFTESMSASLHSLKLTREPVKPSSARSA